LDALPERAVDKFLPTIPGVVPGQFDRPKGCLFAPRCKFADALCHSTSAAPAGADLGLARCHRPLMNEKAAS
jgi:dipeptide transport system ATP-binding protein